MHHMTHRSRCARLAALRGLAVAVGVVALPAAAHGDRAADAEKSTQRPRAEPVERDDHVRPNTALNPRSDLPAGLFARLDANNNGLLSRSEAEADAVLHRNWRSIDNNRDGNVSMAEFRAFYPDQRNVLPPDRHEPRAVQPPDGSQADAHRGSAGEPAPATEQRKP